MKRTGSRLLLAALAWLALASLASANNDESVRLLRLAKFVLPEFPEAVRLGGTAQGFVTAAIGRDAEGRVNDVFVLESTHARLTQAVVEAVKQWKFALPANPPPPETTTFPIVRFIFDSRGVAFVSATTGSLAGAERRTPGRTPIAFPRFTDLDEVPKPLHQPTPRLAGASAAKLSGGDVTVKYFVDETGRVRVPIVLECASPELGWATLAAVEQWQFAPPRVGGRPTIAIDSGKITFRATAP